MGNSEPSGAAAQNHPVTEMLSLGHGLVLEWLYDRQIVCFSVDTLAKATLDLWNLHLVKILKEWPLDRPYLAVHDATPSAGTGLSYLNTDLFNIYDAGFTPQGIDVLAKKRETKEDFTSRLAVVVPDSMSGRASQTLFRFLTRQQPHHQVKLFFRRDAALDWLKTFLPDPTTPPTE